MSHEETITLGFEATAGDEGPLARLLESAPAGSFIEIGKRLEEDDVFLTMKRHIPGRGAVAPAPLRLTTNEGEPIGYQTAVDLLATELEVVESRTKAAPGRLRIA